MAERDDFQVAVLLTGVGKRHDIVSSFARHAFTISADPTPLAPAQYAAHLRVAPPRIADAAYVPFLEALVAEHRVGAVVPLTDLDIHVLAAATTLPAFVAPADICAAMFDKYRTHETLTALGLPSPPTVLPGTEPDSYPVIVKPREGSGARSIHLARDAAQAAFFVDYVDEPVMLQRAMGGHEFSIDVLSDLEGRCLNAIPRSMLESRGGESIKGQVLDDPELVQLARRVAEALGFRGPSTIQVFRDPEIGIAITDVNPRFGGAFPLPLAAGGGYPSLVLALARGERVEPRLGAYRAGVVMTRYLSHVTLVETQSGFEPLSAAEIPAIT